MFTRLFVQNPIFTNVIAIIAVILGIVSLTRLPIALYPDITPPTIAVSASYPGADAETVAKTVGAPIELQVNGVENMIYMSSTSADDGTYSLTVTFALGTDVNIAMVLLQNLVNNALPLLPQVVQQQGVTVTKHSPSILQVIALDSPGGSYDNLFLANYANLQIENVLSRVKGVGQVQAFGAGFYAMRIWLDLDKLNYLGVSVDVVGLERVLPGQVDATKHTLSYEADWYRRHDACLLRGDYDRLQAGVVSRAQLGNARVDQLALSDRLLQRVATAAETNLDRLLN